MKLPEATVSKKLCSATVTSAAAATARTHPRAIGLNCVPYSAMCRNDLIVDIPVFLYATDNLDSLQSECRQIESSIWWRRDWLTVGVSRKQPEKA